MLEFWEFLVPAGVKIVGGHGDQVRTDPNRDLLPIDWVSTE